MSKFKIRVPASSSNLGPGFDVIGLALSLWLELQVTISKPSAASALNCVITCEGQGAEEIEVDPSHNLITRTALYVLRCHHQPVFPPETHVHIINDIFLGRGLGSSGAAVVAGVMLGNALGKCGMSKQRMLDYCLIFERHPDNVAAALFGGFVGTYLSPSNPEEVVKGEIPRSEVLPNTASEVSPQSRAPESPPEGIGHHIKFRWAPEIKVLVIVPNFEVSTAKAREILPKEVPQEDAIFNMQRVALLTHALGQSPPQASMIFEAMQDRLHQPSRKALVPGLAVILETLKPTTHPGLLGVCLSGAGPTILILALHGFSELAESTIRILQSSAKKETMKDVQCEWRILDLADGGAVTSYDGLIR